MLAPLALVVVGALLVPQLGSWLVVDDGPAPADAIIVLAGNTPDRLPYAIQLLRAGYAPLIVVSNERVRTYGLETTWLALYRAGLAAPDLPPGRLLVLDDPPPDSTLDEARRAASLLADHGLHTALLVTDDFHSRRADLLFSAQFRRHGLSLRSTPVHTRVDLTHWWTQPIAARRVGEEWVKLVAYFVQGAYW